LKLVLSLVRRVGKAGELSRGAPSNRGVELSIGVKPSRDNDNFCAADL